MKKKSLFVTALFAKQPCLLNTDNRAAGKKLYLRVGKRVVDSCRACSLKLKSIFLLKMLFWPAVQFCYCDTRTSQNFFLIHFIYFTGTYEPVTDHAPNISGYFRLLAIQICVKSLRRSFLHLIQFPQFKYVIRFI